MRSRILLGDPNPNMLDAPGRLIPVLEEEIRIERSMRYLTPHPGDARRRAILGPIFTVLDGAGAEAEVAR